MAFDTIYPVPEGTISGAPLVVAGIPIVTTQKEGDITDNYATAKESGSFELSVQAIDDSGDTVVNLGESVYYKDRKSVV